MNCLEHSICISLDLKLKLSKNINNKSSFPSLFVLTKNIYLKKKKIQQDFAMIFLNGWDNYLYVDWSMTIILCSLNISNGAYRVSHGKLLQLDFNVLFFSRLWGCRLPKKHYPFWSRLHSLSVVIDYNSVPWDTL